MEREGAAVETLEPDGLAVIAPPEVRSAFGWPELARLGFGVELPVGAQRVGIEGEWLERFGASRHSPSLQTKTTRRIGRVARSRGLMAAWVWACSAMRRRPDRCSDKARRILSDRQTGR